MTIEGRTGGGGGGGEGVDFDEYLVLGSKIMRFDQPSEMCECAVC